MNTQHSEGVAMKACTRCSIQKKRCNRALPECGLCVKLHRRCKYENISSSNENHSPSSRRLDFVLGFGAFTKSQVKSAIMQKLGSFEPKSAILRYSEAIDPWFPIISIPNLLGRLPHTWDETTLDVSLLCLSIVLLTTSPSTSLRDNDNPSEFKSLYFSLKSWISLIEGFGINSLETLQARILVTLFEVMHGFYPTAHISIGSVVRAADALLVYPSEQKTLSQCVSDEAKREEDILTWCGITTLDKYIAAESGSYAPLTRSYNHPIFTPLEPHLCPTQSSCQDHAAPRCRLSCLFEASSLLDKVHTAQISPTTEYLFNVEEIMLVVEATESLKKLLIEDIIDGREMYSGALAVCDISLLTAFENGCKATPVDGISSNCLFLAMKSLAFLLSSITDRVEAFILKSEPSDFELLPPSTLFLVYKTAALVTERLWIDGDSSLGVTRLKTLRQFLQLVEARWLCCERYLQLLDENTTPRISRLLGK